MPEFVKKWTFSEEAFEKIFKEVDLDGNGAIDRNEMTEFLTKLLS